MNEKYEMRVCCGFNIFISCLIRNLYFFYFYYLTKWLLITIIFSIKGFLENKIRSEFLFEFSRNLKVVVRHIIHPSPNKEKTKRESRRYIFKSKQHLQGKQQFHSSFEIKQMQAMDLHDSIPNASYDMMYCKCHHLHFTHHVRWI